MKFANAIWSLPEKITLVAGECMEKSFYNHKSHWQARDIHIHVTVSVWKHETCHDPFWDPFHLT